MAKKKESSKLIDDYHLLSYDVIDSTNDEARRLAQGGAAHGAVIWAKKQTAGRGRLQRPWVSEDGNLFVSVLLQPNCDIATSTQLSFVTAVAVMDALKPIVPHHTLACKWPNDILLDGKKLAGILIETHESDVGGERKRWVIVGLGLNVESHPANVTYPATSLREAGVEIISAKIVLSRFVYHFIQAYDLWDAKGFSQIRKDWMVHAYGIGKPVEVRLPEERIVGVFKGIEKNGALEMQLPGGRKRTITAGDVVFG